METDGSKVRKTETRRRPWQSMLAGLLLAAPPFACAQSGMPAGTPQQWVQKAADAERQIIENDGSFPLRYRTHKIDTKGDVLRDMIETRDGAVARLVQRDGRPLTGSENQAERQRLQDVLTSPADFIKHHKKDAESRKYASDLVQLLPTAMRLTYTPGQPQPAGATGPQVVIDFTPDPAFKPPNIVSELLTGVEGRFWIDARTGCMTRGEARIIHPVNFGWGVLAQIHEGGTISFAQTNVGGNRWAYSAMNEHLVIREMLFKTAPQNTQMQSFDFALLPGPVTLQQAVQMLLNEPVPTR